MTEKPAKQSEKVEVELNPASGVDVLGDPPVLVSPAIAGGPAVGGFTKAEAKALLELRNAHGTQICRVVGS